MKTEFEATFPNISKEEIKNKLESLGAICEKKEFLMKRVTFNLPSNERGTWLRIRDEGDKITLSLKSIQNEGRNIEDQKEIFTKIDDFDEGVELLERVGCIKKAFQENKREIWILNEVEIVIDEWPFLEPFVEIEGKDEESVRNISGILGFDYSTAIFSSTDVQYSNKYGVSEDFVVNNVSRIAFGDKNPFINNTKI
jgi:adenylate cyclase, class 2